MSRIVKKHNERKKEIIDAVLMLFMENGYHETTTTLIIEYLKIAKGTFYHYFSSKEMVLEAIIDRFINELIKEVNLIIENPDYKILEKMELIAYKELEINFKHLPDIHKLQNIDIQIRIIKKLLQSFVPLLEKVVLSGIHEKIFQTEYSHELIEYMVVSTHTLFDPGIYKWSKENLTKKIKFLIEITESVLKAQKGSFDFYLNVFGKIYNYEL